ncbi:uncharacterized protein LOC134232856 [Saccostrea cucullata]|uniref:uncharacterized protein LOC134232856 n=1 Tax=Saccostrea cuccullata TaxID=36930 RepID=UPI002ED1B336
MCNHIKSSTDPVMAKSTIILILFMLSLSSAMVIRCNQPLSLSYTKSEKDIQKESRYIVPRNNGIRYGVGTLYTIDANFINIQYSAYSDRTTCEEVKFPPRGRFHLSVAESASCPWYYRKNVDENRVPREFIEAKCACRCSVHDSVCARKTCREVYRYVTVLRRTSCTEVVEVIEPIAVGCTEVHLQQRINPHALDE